MTINSSPLVILDRDGVINYDSENHIKSAAEWSPIPNSLEAIVSLNQANISVAIATNQSGISHKYFSIDGLNKIHHKLKTMLIALGGKIDLICYCPHIDQDHCSCRKPKPGLIWQIAKHFNIDLEQQTVPFVGDSLRDLQAAQAAKCLPVLVKTGNGKKTLEKIQKNPVFSKIKTYQDLFAAVPDLIMYTQNKDGNHGKH